MVMGVSDGKLYPRKDMTPDIVRTIYRMYIEGNGANKNIQISDGYGIPNPRADKRSE